MAQLTFFARLLAWESFQFFSQLDFHGLIPESRYFLDCTAFDLHAIEGSSSKMIKLYENWTGCLWPGAAGLNFNILAYINFQQTYVTRMQNA